MLAYLLSADLSMHVPHRHFSLVCIHERNDFVMQCASTLESSLAHSPTELPSCYPQITDICFSNVFINLRTFTEIVKYPPQQNQLSHTHWKRHIICFHCGNSYQCLEFASPKKWTSTKINQVSTARLHAPRILRLLDTPQSCKIGIRVSFQPKVCLWAKMKGLHLLSQTNISWCASPHPHDTVLVYVKIELLDAQQKQCLAEYYQPSRACQMIYWN